MIRRIRLSRNDAGELCPADRRAGATPASAGSAVNSSHLRRLITVGGIPRLASFGLVRSCIRRMEVGFPRPAVLRILLSPCEPVRAQPLLKARLVRPTSADHPRRPPHHPNS